MQKIWVVFKHEFISVIARRSYIISLILLPLISSAIFLVAAKMNQQSGTQQNPIAEIVTPKQSTLPEGLVDHASIIATIPIDVQDKLVLYTDESEAETAMLAEKISGYYVISADYLQSGEVLAYQKDYNVMSGMESSWVVEQVIRDNLLDRVGVSRNNYDTPIPDLSVHVQETNVQQPQQLNPDNGLTFMIPYVVSLLFYTIIITTSSMLMNSITTEKENRVMEILLTSMTPETMLIGKIVSRGVVGLLQFALWGGTGWLLLQASGQSFQVPAEFQIQPSFLLWGVLYLILGYFLYSVLMASVGALAPNMRESSQVTFLFVMPMIIPLMFVSVFAQKPNAALPVFLSYFPLTSPIAMMMRLSVTSVPVWSLLLSALLLGVTAYLCLRLIAGIFRADVLLSSGSLNIKRFFKAVFQQNRA